MIRSLTAPTISLTVTNRDSAGNESAPSTPVTITIDTDAPAQPGTPTVTDSVSQITGPVLDGESTNDPRPVLSGTGTPNDVITIYDRGYRRAAGRGQRYGGR